jgi:hypothetical protein
VKSLESQSTFRRNVSPPFSGSKDKPRKKSCIKSSVSCLLNAGILLGLFFDPEDGGDMFPRKVC